MRVVAPGMPLFLSSDDIGGRWVHDNLERDLQGAQRRRRTGELFPLGIDEYHKP